MESMNFTPRAQQVLVIAKQAASQAQNLYVGTEHILIGLINLSQGIAFNVMKSANIDFQDVIKKLTQQMATNAAHANPDECPEELDEKFDNITFTPRAKKVLVYSANEARAMHHPYIGTEHILLGILREGEGAAAKILAETDLTLEKCKQEILETLDPNFASSTLPSHADKTFGSLFENQKDKSSINSKTSALKTYGRDLTALAREGLLDPVIGREKEIQRAIQILSRRTKNNPALLGEAGVGKTAIVEGLAQAIADEKVPKALLDKQIFALDLALMVAGTKYRGQFEERLKSVMDEVKRAKNVILFLDEFHTIVGAGASEGSMDASNILKPALSRSEIQCIGATTISEYRKNIEKDSALERRFQAINVDPPSINDAIRILNGIKGKYEEFHNVKYSEKIIELSVKLAERYISDRFLPDKAIDILDEVGANAHLNTAQPPSAITELIQKIEKNKEKLKKAQETDDTKNIQKYEQKEQKLKNKHDKLLQKWKDESTDKMIKIVDDDVYKIVANCTGIPLSRLETQETERLLNLTEELSKSVIGQQDATEMVARALRRSRADLKDPKRPIGAFLFLGPTGVGKTLLAKVLAEKVFNNERALIQIDMSEYMEKHAVSRMAGSPPGYVGHEEGGQLTEQVRRRPYSVILFDEIEKAHPDILQILLQVLEDGHMTDSMGRKVDFKNTILILTSNVGAEILQKKISLGFGNNASADFEKTKERILDEAKKTFKPEFINRLSDVIVFKPLTKKELTKIIDLEFAKIAERARAKDLDIILSDQVKEFLIEKGYDDKYGARQLRRTIEYWIEDYLAEEILRGNFKPHSKIRLILDDNGKIDSEYI